MVSTLLGQTFLETVFLGGAAFYVGHQVYKAARKNSYINDYLNMSAWIIWWFGLFFFFCVVCHLFVQHNKGARGPTGSPTRKSPSKTNHARKPESRAPAAKKRQQLVSLPAPSFFIVLLEFFFNPYSRCVRSDFRDLRVYYFSYDVHIDCTRELEMDVFGIEWWLMRLQENKEAAINIIVSIVIAATVQWRCNR